MAFGAVFQGSLFAHDFLADSIAGMPDWAELDDAAVAQVHDQIRNVLRRFPTDGSPNEADTEGDLIWPVLEALGWGQYLRQQNLSARGRDDVPDGLLFADQAAKDQANANPEEWRRYGYGKALVESKRWDRPLDRRSGRRDEDGTPSTQMLRYLRRADDLTNGSLRWGILTNGARWRLYWAGARSVSEQFFDIDLAAVMDLPNRNEGLFALSDEERAHAFKVFVAIFRREAFLPGTGDLPPFHIRAIEQGKFYEQRVADNLSGVVFQTVFPELAAAIAEAAPAADLQEVREAALILLYRLLFILYAEDRDLLPVHDARYDDYGLRERVRGDVGRRKDEGDTFSSSAARYWSAIDDLCRAIDEGDGSIGLPPYNGGLFNRENTSLLTQIRLGDQVMADVIDVLSFEVTPQGRRYINYRDLSVQQLGSIYERLLEHEVVREQGAVVVRLNPFARKGSGSYYTPDDLVRLILKETLEPLVSARKSAFAEAAEAAARARGTEDVRRARLAVHDPAERLLDLKICDPAMGSGHFLVSLVDYLADEVIAAMAEVEVSVDWTDYVSPLAERIDRIRTTILANAEAENWTVDQEQLDDRHIVRRMVLKRCVYGVDKNVMAVELAKVSLWLHTFTVGAPLSFLDHHLRCGDSLFGSWVRGGMDKAGEYGSPLLLNGPMRAALGAAASMTTIEGLTDAEIAEAHRSADIFDGVQEATEPLNAFLSLIHALDWLNLREREDTAAIRAFFDGQFGDPVRIAQGLEVPRRGRPEGARFTSILDAARTLVSEERFLNWQVAFPGVWREWESNNLVGGFDAVIGNPPWDRIKLQQVEWFAARRREIALAQRAADRKRMIEALEADGDPLYQDFLRANDRAEASARVARRGGHFPLLSGGDINLYSLFVERAMTVVKPDGIVGLLVPSGIASDKTASKFFQSVATEGRLKALYDFENKKVFFPDVHASFKFCIFCAARHPTAEAANCAFYLHSTAELDDPERCFPLSAEDFARVNPNTGTAPIFRSRRDADLTTAIYERLPVLVDRSGGTVERAWPIKYLRMFDMTNDSGQFRTREQLEEDEGAYPIGGNRYGSPVGEWVPLYVGRMIHQFDHRAASVTLNAENIHNAAFSGHISPEQKSDPTFVPTPQYWVRSGAVELEDLEWCICFRDIARATDVRTMIAASIPKSGVGNTVPLILPDNDPDFRRQASLLLGNLNSLILDYVVRQKAQSTHLNWYIVEQLPVVPIEAYEATAFGPKTAAALVREAVLELTYTAHDMAPFARDMGYVDEAGVVLPPFVWDDERRLRLRAKLDAVYFHLYGITDRDDIRYIYSTFPIVEREETAVHGRYLSRDLCLAYFNALTAGDPDAEPQV
ncbi:Eco57I restriction-modification methylase domain-containing protein [Pacificispira sp.]|uniref:Eco57I restriction-modification methylase domain-containing protein n=1 Tax=Pacificispira sp. TaxID=2888761 RepID=UPI003B515682